MITFDQIATATLDQLTDELGAAGWDSTQTELRDARDAVARLLVAHLKVDELMQQLDDAGFDSLQNWQEGSTEWFVVPDELSVKVTGEEVETTRVF